MAHTLADLIAFRDRLIAARLSGVRSVTDQNGESIEYKSDAQMAAALAYVERLIAGAGPSTIVFSTSKGLR